MRDIRKELIEMLIAEVKPAVGCTEPVAVALACAKAKELLGEEIEENRILVSPSIYKNGMCVGIPGTDRLGLKIAVAMGFVGGHSENGLTVLETLSQDEVEESERYMDTQPINVVPAQTKDKVFIEVDLRGKNNIAKVVIKEKHDNFVYLQKNQEVLLDTGDYNNNEEIKVADENVVERKATFMDTTNVEEIIKNVENMNFEDIKFLLDGITMNVEMADYGLENKAGIGVGFGIKKAKEEGYMADDLMTEAMMLTAAASDARMAGIKMPVMSSNGSGNHGLTAILPIVAYNNKFPQSEERSAAGISWLMDGDMTHIKGAIENMIANLSGMICDGAKAGCALKLSSAASAAVQSAIIAKQGFHVPPKNGIVGDRVDESIKNLGKVSDEGMQVTDEVIIDVMNNINKVK